MTPLAVAAWSMTTPFGKGDATIDALFAGRCALSPQWSPWKLRNTSVAVIAGRPPGASDRRWQRHLGAGVLRDVLTALAPDRRRSAIVFATSYGHLLDDPGDDTMSTWAGDCLNDIGWDVDPIVVGSGCSSGSDAIGVAAALLDGGMADIAIVVAVDIVTAAKRLAHSTLGTMAVVAQRPFDTARDGMLLGEAAAAVALMRSEDCPHPIGELLGIGAANDAFGLTAPDPSGLSVRFALARALAAARLDPADLALYLAHGTATPLNDELEAAVVAEVFNGNDDLAIVGTKGALGHALGACGLVEFILLLQMLAQRRAPPTVGLVDPIPGVAARFAGAAGRALGSGYGVSVTLGFGGFNTALIARA